MALGKSRSRRFAGSLPVTSGACLLNSVDTADSSTRPFDVCPKPIKNSHSILPCLHTGQALLSRRVYFFLVSVTIYTGSMASVPR